MAPSFRRTPTSSFPFGDVFVRRAAVPRVRRPSAARTARPRPAATRLRHASRRPADASRRTRAEDAREEDARERTRRAMCDSSSAYPAALHEFPVEEETRKVCRPRACPGSARAFRHTGSKRFRSQQTVHARVHLSVLCRDRISHPSAPNAEAKPHRRCSAGGDRRRHVASLSAASGSSRAAMKRENKRDRERPPPPGYERLPSRTHARD
jgi:hypothetical protein